MKKSIAVIGQGFVGGSLTTVFSERGFDVLVYDKAGKTALGAHDYRPDSLKSLVKFAESNKAGFTKIYFVCLPTPMYEDGSADLSIVEDVLTELSQFPGDRIAVVKSTVPPGSTERWNKMFADTGLRVVFNPEFLTERTALEDMRTQNTIVLGGDHSSLKVVKQIFNSAFPNSFVAKTDSNTAEMVKYLINNFLTVKVSFANEISQICEALTASGITLDYDKVVEYASQDPRIGKSHWNVPGPDGNKGFGGHCFPKDINAMIALASKSGVDAKILKTAWQKNLEVRPDRDWEKMIGRAVSKKTLDQLGVESGTDKCSIVHNFCDFYDKYLTPLRDSKIRFLEIGISKQNSMSMWRKYFPHAEIHGIDVYAIKPSVDDVKYHVVNMDSTSQIENFVERTGNWDVILDDGGHTMRQQQNSIVKLWPTLKSGGIFIMEDLHTSFTTLHKEFLEEFNPKGVPTTFDFVKALQEKTSFTSPYLNQDDFERISKEVDKVVIWWRGDGSVEEIDSVTSIIFKR